LRKEKCLKNYFTNTSPHNKNMNSTFKIPFYARVALISICIFAFVFTMKIGQDIIVPLLYATILAILLNPLVNFLVRKKINKVLSISIAVTLSLFAVMGVLYIISTQVTMFSESYPQLQEKMGVKSTELVHLLAKTFKIQETKINTWISETEVKAINNFAIGATLAEAGKMIVIGLLLPVYLFMILYYKPLLLEFISKLFKSEHHVTVNAILTNTKSIIQTYLVGLFFEVVIMAVLNSTGLLILGIDYAIILGITGAILNIIPYIGGVIAIALPMVIAFVTKDSLIYPGLVLLIYLFTQFIDNHYISPKIVASRVKINALVSMIGVIIGGTIWGIPGMFLSIPLIGIIKVIFDHIESLKPWGFLLGNTVPTKSTLSLSKIIKKRRQV
jgi:predicted PurR-regulated permease PerM